jgi:hypothetical protein
MAHYPGDYDVAGVTEGFPPADDGTVPTPEQALSMIQAAEPYADRILKIADLNQFQASQIAPEDAKKPAPKVEDYPSERPFQSASRGTLTTYPSLQYNSQVLLKSLGIVLDGDTIVDVESTS